MDFLASIISGLLLEEANKDSVIDAVKKHYEVNINYKADDDPKGNGERIIQPCVYGTTQAGNPAIRAFQPYGDTKTKVPHWKIFLLDKIVNWESHPENVFQEPPNFNSKGDRGMSEVYVISNFGERTTGKYDTLRKNIENAKDGNKIDYVRRNLEDWYKRRDRRQTKNNAETKGNTSSIENMSDASNFGDNNGTQTVGPVRKGKENTTVEKNTDIDYGKAIQNGPVYQNTDKEQLFKTDSENNPNKYDALKKNIENAKDGNEIDYVRRNIEDWYRRKYNRENKNISNSTDEQQ